MKYLVLLSNEIKKYLRSNGGFALLLRGLHIRLDDLFKCVEDGADGNTKEANPRSYEPNAEKFTGDGKVAVAPLAAKKDGNVVPVCECVCVKKKKKKKKRGGIEKNKIDVPISDCIIGYAVRRLGWGYQHARATGESKV